MLAAASWAAEVVGRQQVLLLQLLAASLHPLCCCSGAETRLAGWQPFLPEMPVMCAKRRNMS